MGVGRGGVGGGVGEELWVQCRTKLNKYIFKKIGIRLALPRTEEPPPALTAPPSVFLRPCVPREPGVSEAFCFLRSLASVISSARKGITCLHF